jgi:glycosyltransferase involved in cell wall biosynthesis
VRILLITLFFPPKYNAGTENYTLGLARALINRGHEVQVLCAESWQTGEAYWNGVTEEIYQDVPVFRFKLNWEKASNPNLILFDSPLVEAWLDRFLAEREFDLVHVVSAITLGIGVLRSVKRAALPLILTLMDFWFVCPSIQLLRSNGDLCDGRTTAWQCQSCLLSNSHLFQKINTLPVPEFIKSETFGMLSHVNFVAKQRGLRGMLLNMKARKQRLSKSLLLPDRILAHSKTVSQFIGINSPVQIDILQNGQDLTWLKHYEGKSPSGKLRFGYIGQIQANKGVHLLIQAFLKAGISENAQLDIYGDLTRNMVYAERLDYLRHDNPAINFCGRFDREQIASVLANIDVLVVPSLWYENAPLVIQEGFATKTPVIATDLGGMSEVVHHDVNGLLFKRGDVEDLTSQIRRIYDDENLLNHLREGIPQVKTIENEVSELELIYRDLIDHQVLGLQE